MTKLSGDRDYSLFNEAHNYGPWNSPVPYIGADIKLIMANLGFRADDDIYINGKDGSHKMVSFHVHLRFIFVLNSLRHRSLQYPQGSTHAA